MGCLVRGIVGLVCLVSLVLSAMGYLGMQIVNEEKETAGRLALEAPEKRLDEALRQDGPAWVKGRIEVASGSAPLVCGAQSCLWRRTERYETLAEDIKSGGAWTKRFASRKVKDEKRGVAFDLVADPARLRFDDWLGIVPADDLLQTRHDQAPLMQETPESLPASAAAAWQVKERFLLPDQEVWLLASFTAGKALGYVNGSVYMTGLGPKRFAQEIGAMGETASNLRWLFLVGVVIPILYFGFLILKRTS
ncbi:MAG TPA: hypothetical protein PLP29_08675 [Candidatus Ozemobacteraceae bacterium]|nr:hypothetical protein [Candidatus Ozemobacteraceae bacterium]